MKHIMHKLLRLASCVGTVLGSLTYQGVRSGSCAPVRRNLPSLATLLQYMRDVAGASVVSALLVLFSVAAHAELNVLVVEGLGGEAKYSQQFDKDVKAVRAASATLTTAERIHVLSADGATRANVEAMFKQLASTSSKDDRLIVYLIGHGSYDGYEYKFNIPGPDLSGAELAKLLDAVKSENQLVVATGSASGALQEALKKDSRVIVTATRNGNERNATQFSSLFAEALADATADTDKNGRLSAQEAFDFTTRKVKDYFEAESKLSTEHAQLSGTRANVFAIAQLNGAAASTTDSTDAVQVAQREQLNSQLEELRLRKDSLSEDDYLQQLEPLLIKIAELDAQTNGEGGKEAKP